MMNPKSANDVEGLEEEGFIDIFAVRTMEMLDESEVISFLEECTNVSVVSQGKGYTVAIADHTILGTIYGVTTGTGFGIIATKR